MPNEPHRLSWKAALTGIAVCALAVGITRAEDVRTIEGQVFIRTKGGDSIKLSLVDILLFDKKAITQNLDAKRKVAEPICEALQPFVKEAKKQSDEAQKIYDTARQAWVRSSGDGTPYKTMVAAQTANSKCAEALWDISGKADYAHSALYYFSNLPTAAQTTKTDADGKFSFKLPAGAYVVAAVSSRSAGKGTEFYNWMINVSVNADTKVMLANDNLSSSGSADSLIHTPDEEGYIASAVMDLGIDKLMGIAEYERRKQAVTETARQEATRQAQLAETARIEMERQAQLKVFRKNPKAAQLKAIELYPDVGVAGSPLNKEFVERLKRYQTEKKAFFAEPDWPVRLTKECSEAVAAKPVPK